MMGGRDVGIEQFAGALPELTVGDSWQLGALLPGLARNGGELVPLDWVLKELTDSWWLFEVFWQGQYFRTVRVRRKNGSLSFQAVDS